jgi:endonuclease/exonuclease/phosphatase family metal-dependent hydrolase
VPEISAAVNAFKAGGITHAEAVKTYLPGILEPYTDNSLAGVSSDSQKTGDAPGFRAAVFNMERGAYLKQIIAYFTYHPMLRLADVVFANEVDWGMARTGNADIAREFAAALGYNYAYGVEFLTEKAGRDGNGRGLHGNAVFSRFPLTRAKVIQLPIQYEWFYKEGDCRLGMRCAVLAEADTPAGKAGLVSVHLENRAKPEGRKVQMEFLLDRVEEYFGAGLPVLIGGDMNTNTVDGNSDADMLGLARDPDEMWRRVARVPAFEPLMDYAASRGFGYADCNALAKTTRRKPMDDGRTVALNLDWFFQRGFCCSDPVKIESIFHKNGLVDAPEETLRYQGQEMSDHDMVMVTCGAARGRQ